MSPKTRVRRELLPLLFFFLLFYSTFFILYCSIVHLHRMLLLRSVRMESETVAATF